MYNGAAAQYNGEIKIRKLAEIASVDGCRQRFHCKNILRPLISLQKCLDESGRVAVTIICNICIVRGSFKMCLGDRVRRSADVEQ